MKILFLLKKNYSYDYPKVKSAGLFNSANFLIDGLKNHLCIDTRLEICIDSNEIDAYLVKHKPEVCFLEALWVPPYKFKELTALHKNVKFVIRVHSNIPFLANEGMAIQWIKECSEIPGVEIAFNNLGTLRDFKSVDLHAHYLPNLYYHDKIANIETSSLFNKFLCSIIKKKKSKREIINIGCFGAIRPMKNQLMQAIAAVEFSNKHGYILNFHINSTRVEQKGESALKNIKSLFKNSKHNLIEHGWADHTKFLELVKKMDLGMQVSLTESFNIVTADFVSQKVPIVVSTDISWMPNITKTTPLSVQKIVKKMDDCFKDKDAFVKASLRNLHQYNKNSLHAWKVFLFN